MHPEDNGNSIKIHIIESAMSLFCSKGYHGTSTNEICNIAKITKPTLYYHFRNKQNLFFAAHMRLIDLYLIPILKCMKNETSPEKQICYFIHSYVNAICTRPELKILVHENQFLEESEAKTVIAHWAEVVNYLRSVLRKLKKEKNLKNFNDAFYTMSLIGMCTWVYYWFDYNRPDGIAELSESITKLFFSGILGVEYCENQ